MAPRKRAALEALARMGRRGDPGKFKPWAVSALRGPVGGLIKLAFRPRIDGWEHLPETGPYMIVGNHSGGGVAEILSLAMLWAERFGDERPIASMAHPLGIGPPGIGHGLSSLGAIPSTREDALAALESGLPILVYPGGDHEAFRPIWEASKVDLAGRKGFLRLAQKVGAPIVPLGTWGSHFTQPILGRSKILAVILVLPRLIGLKRVPVTVSGVLGASAILALLHESLGLPLTAVLAVIWFFSPLAWSIPTVPWSIKARIGAPIAAEALFSDQDSDLSESYRRVENEIQTIVTALSEGR